MTRRIPIPVPAGCEVAQLEPEPGLHLVVLTPMGQLRDLDVFVGADFPGTTFVMPGTGWPHPPGAAYVAERLRQNLPACMICLDGEEQATALRLALVAARAPAPPGTAYARFAGDTRTAAIAGAVEVLTRSSADVAAVQVILPSGERLTLDRTAARDEPGAEGLQ